MNNTETYVNQTVAFYRTVILILSCILAFTAGTCFGDDVTKKIFCKKYVDDDRCSEYKKSDNNDTSK